MYDHGGGSSRTAESTTKLDPPRPFRPPLLHRPTSNSARRWTLAVNHITDDADFLREIDALKRTRDSNDFAADVDIAGEAEADEEYERMRQEDLNAEDEEEQVWMKARRAMLCVREIIRTETAYRRHLVRVFEAEVSFVPTI